MQIALVELCEAHWNDELRVPQPAGLLARAVWSLTPPLSDLLLDLHAAGDWRLDAMLPGRNLAKGMALLVLAEVEHGNEAGVHLAHESMMAFQSAPPPAAWLERINALLSGTLAPPQLHAHDHHGALWRSLATIAIQTHRLDLPALLAVIRLLATPGEASAASGDASLTALRNAVLAQSIRFLGIENDEVCFEQHGHAHEPVRTRQVSEMLLDIRRLWLG